MSALRSRLTLEYDGSGFCGWAVQPERRSVAAELTTALSTLLRREVAVTVAGRTDRGVHAWGQVVSYPGEPVEVAALNALLPADVAALSCERAADGFDARRDALSRTYCYRILNRRARGAFERGRALWCPRRLDPEALDACAAALIGRHDFTAFTPTDTAHVRFERDVIAARWQRDGDRLDLWIEADAFMRHMTRVLVGTMLEVGVGRRSVESFVELLGGRPRSAAGATAPPHGLYLAAVSYAASVIAPTSAERSSTNPASSAERRSAPDRTSRIQGT